MKKLFCTVLLLGLVSFAFAQRQPEKSPLQAMVDTERAFAQLAADKGTRDAFLGFIADDGVLFRPRLVKGKQWLIEHPAPVSDKRPLLSWYPAVAGIARAGDMGYSTGPWEFKRDSHDAKSIAWGHFLTIWKKQAVGEWKFAIDLGISNPEPSQAEAPWTPPKNYKTPKPMRGRWTFSTEALLARDREFLQTALKRGIRAAFTGFAATDVRLYRDEKFPIIGKEQGAAALPASTTVWTWEPAAGDVSISDDLGYTYGTYKIADAAAKVLESGNYFRIWKKEGGRWKVLFDLTNPVAAQ